MKSSLGLRADVLLLVVLSQLALLAHHVQGVGRLKSTKSTNSSWEDIRNVKLLIALWRHGDRAPLYTYANDPYKDDQYLPEGKGNLNNKGKWRAYKLGRLLRRLYCPFLGNEIISETAYLRSTYVHRCIESGQLVMAGMYPPGPDQIWDSNGLGRIWTPVAFNSDPSTEDTLLEPSAGSNCAAYLEDLETAEAALISNLTSKYNETILYVEEKAGVNSTGSVIELVDTLICQESLGLTLPNWTEPVYPEPLKTMLGDLYGMYVYTARQRRLIAGVFLNNLKETAVAYQNGSLSTSRKLYGYSAHDITIVFVMSALGIWDGRVPPFSSALIFELRQINSTDLGFKVLFSNNTSSDPVAMTLPGCDLICPLTTFEQLYEDDFLTTAEQEAACEDT